MSIINAHIQRTKDPAEELAGAMEDLALALRSSARGSMDAAQYSGEALKMLTRGQLKVNTEVLGSEAPLSHLGKIVNRLTIGIIIAGLFIGSEHVVALEHGARLLGVPVLSRSSGTWAPRSCPSGWSWTSRGRSKERPLLFLACISQIR